MTEPICPMCLAFYWRERHAPCPVHPEASRFWRNTRPAAYKCAHCDLYQWQTSGAPIIGGVHVCVGAIIAWLELTDNEDDSILSLEIAQRQ